MPLCLMVCLHSRAHLKEDLERALLLDELQPAERLGQALLELCHGLGVLGCQVHAHALLQVRSEWLRPDLHAHVHGWDVP